MRKLCLSKGGKTSGLAATLMVLGIVALAIFIIAQFGVFEGIGGEDEIPKVGGLTGSECENAPYVSNSTFNRFTNAGVSVTYTYQNLDSEGNPVKSEVTGQTVPAQTLTTGSSGTNFKVGDKIRILSSASGYIDSVDDFEIKNCDKNEFVNFIDEGDAITLDLLDDSLSDLSDTAASGGSVNITDGGAETTGTFIVRIKSARDKSTGQVLITLEANDTEVDTMTINARTSGAKVVDDNANSNTGLKLFVAEGTAPVAKFTFVVDSAEDAATDDYEVTADAESGKTLGATAASGFLYVNAYAAQWFSDTDGVLKLGWEDANGNLKAEQTATDHDALFS